MSEDTKQKISDKYNETKEKINESREKTKESLSNKLDQSKVKFNEEKEKTKESVSKNREETKNKINEKKLQRAIDLNNRKFESHIEVADKRITRVLNDAEDSIDLLFAKVDAEVSEEDSDIGLIIFRAQNKVNEIILKRDYKLQIIINDLIDELIDDVAKAIELDDAVPEDFDAQAKVDKAVADLQEKIGAKKEEFDKKLDED